MEGEKDTYVEQAEGHAVPGKEDWVCKLNRLSPLYGIPPAGYLAQKKLVTTKVDGAGGRQLSSEP